MSDLSSLLYSSSDPNELKASASASLQSACSDQSMCIVAQSTIQNFNGDANASNAAGGVLVAAQGGTPSDSQIQSGFALVATGAAVAAGMTAAAASAVIAPMALFVFGGGMLIGDAIKSALGITNSSPVSCSSNDPTHYGNDPSDPNWITYQDYVNNGTTRHAPDPSPLPIVNGPFSVWATPIILRAFELGANCKPLPGVRSWRDFTTGLVAAWNSQFPGAPMRTITAYGADVKNPPPGDFVTMMIQLAAIDQYEQGTGKLIQPELPQPWQITVADPPKTTVALHLRPTTDAIAAITAAVAIAKTAQAAQASTVPPAKVVGIAAAVGAVALLAPAGYALAKGKAVDAVYSSIWRSIKGVFR